MSLILLYKSNIYDEVFESDNLKVLCYKYLDLINGIAFSVEG